MSLKVTKHVLVSWWNYRSC